MKKILSFLKDKFKNKIQIIIIILVIVLFPIIIRILECIFDFDIDANGWVGFLGSYIGSIIGAITALMVVNIEIKNSRKEKKNDEIKQLRPYLWLFVESIENNNVCGKIKNIGLNTAIFHLLINRKFYIAILLYVKMMSCKLIAILIWIRQSISILYFTT